MDVAWDHYYLNVIKDGHYNDWSGSHDYWKRFITFVQDSYTDVYWSETNTNILKDIIDIELLKFHAIVTDWGTSFARIIFETDAARTYFLLRWS